MGDEAPRFQLEGFPLAKKRRIDLGPNTVPENFLVLDNLTICHQRPRIQCSSFKDTGRGRCTITIAENGRPLHVSNEYCNILTSTTNGVGHARIRLADPFKINMKRLLVPNPQRKLVWGGRYGVSFELEPLADTQWPPFQIDVEEGVVGLWQSPDCLLATLPTQCSLEAGNHRSRVVLQCYPDVQYSTEYYLEYKIRTNHHPPLSYLPFMSRKPATKQDTTEKSSRTIPSTPSSTGAGVMWKFEETSPVAPVRIKTLTCLFCLRDGETRTTGEQLVEHMMECHSDSYLSYRTGADGVLHISCRPHKDGMEVPAVPHRTPSPVQSPLPEPPIDTSPMQVDDRPQATAPDIGKLLFHTQSFAVLQPGEDVPLPYVDKSAIIRKNSDRVRNIRSMSSEEKEYAARWALVWDGNPDEGDAILPEMLLRFVTQNAEWMLGSMEQRLQFSRDLIILQAKSELVDDDCIEQINKAFRTASQQRQQKPPAAREDPSLGPSNSVCLPPEKQCSMCQQPLTVYNSLRCTNNKCRNRVHKFCVTKELRRRKKPFICERCLDSFSKNGIWAT